MKKFLRNRVVIGFLCMLLAGLIAFVGVPISNNISQKKMNVVRAKTSISAGTIITKDMVQTDEMGKENQPANVLTDESNAIGKFAMVDIQKEDQITSTKVSKTLSMPNAKIRSLKPDEQALTIAPRSEASSFAYNLLPNDIVSVYEVNEKKGAQVVPELTYVSMVVATTADGTQILKENQVDANGKSLVPSTMTFIVNNQQAKKLIELSSNSKLYFVLKYRGSNDTIRQKYINAQNEYFGGANTVGAVDDATSASVTAGSSTAGSSNTTTSTTSADNTADVKKNN